jgi:arabinogalactan endo-1,4-beta-galactosidase
MKKLFSILGLTVLLTGCSGQIVESINVIVSDSINIVVSDSTAINVVDSTISRDPLGDRVIVNDYDVNVYEKITPNFWLSEGVLPANEEPVVTLDYANGFEPTLRLEGNSFIGLTTDASVTLILTVTTSKGVFNAPFTVNVHGRDYVEKYDRTSWFEDIDVTPSPELVEGDDFAVGTDISMLQQVLDSGGHYYNANGKEENVYKVMKDSGVNTVRIRLWVDPYYYEYDNAGEVTLKSAYGGGICDTETVTKMAVEATKAGLDVMICTHYSDYWSTGGQVMPKPWYKLLTDGVVTTVEGMAEVIKNYTKDTLQYMIDAGADIRYWQLGNENLGGILLRAPGDVTKARGAGDAYNQGKALGAYSSFAGNGGATGNFGTYLKAMIAGVKEVSPSTETILHSANVGGAFASYITAGVDFDIMGVSAYIQYNHGTPAALKANHYNNLGSTEALLAKKLMIVETSYAYTLDTVPYASHNFTSTMVNTYEVSVQGQADNLRDTIDSLAAQPNGAGVITWEGAWLPVYGAGWSDPVTSSASWTNQAFFSFDGKALPSLSVFGRVWTKAE